jgi:patatin-like phospholipase/acyl hydrolase
LASGKSASEVVQLFSEENARKVFSDPNDPPLTRPKYSNLNLKMLLKSVFPAKLRLADLKHRVVIPSFQVIGPGRTPWKPIFFHNFPFSPTRFERVIDVALASSAVPVYFPSYNNFIDGGVIANNPSTAAISFAIDNRAGSQRLTDVALFSFGTGYNPHKIVGNTTTWGITQWVNPLFGPDDQPSLPLLTVTTEGASEVDTLLSSSLLNNRFFRLNPELKEDIPLDSYQMIPKLINFANSVDLKPAINYLKRFW